MIPILKGVERLHKVRLGRLEYGEAWALQKKLAEARAHDQIPDQLLLVEHPHTYTLGANADESHLVYTEAERMARGISLYRTDRGGDVTYHGLGQLVGYPILKLPAGGDGLHADVVGYVRMLEAILIQTLAVWGIQGERLAGYSGVWVATGGTLAKIAAIGVRVNSRRVTTHGFALNVNTDLSYFKGIIPCGISDKPVIGMQELIGSQTPLAQVSEEIEAAFEAVWGDAQKTQ
ncbi:lipoyl(octanoyl) transferase [Anaerolineae bacterium]|nr:lipoyl(octanoyl) transferase [Anaerolineae bacterium]